MRSARSRTDADIQGQLVVLVDEVRALRALLDQTTDEPVKQEVPVDS